jgi:hypothetical protein
MPKTNLIDELPVQEKAFIIPLKDALSLKQIAFWYGISIKNTIYLILNFN